MWFIICCWNRFQRRGQADTSVWCSTFLSCLKVGDNVVEVKGCYPGVLNVCMFPFLIINCSVLCSESVPEPCVCRSGATSWDSHTSLCCSNTEFYITEDGFSWCWPFSSGLWNCDKPHAFSEGRCEVGPFCVLLRSNPCLQFNRSVYRPHSLSWGELNVSP